MPKAKPDPIAQGEALLEVLRELNGEVPCLENLEAITHVQQAVSWLESREATRKEQGVKGSKTQHAGPHIYICTDCGKRLTLHEH